jgi:hypothetical protein
MTEQIAEIIVVFGASTMSTVSPLRTIEVSHRTPFVIRNGAHRRRHDLLRAHTAEWSGIPLNTCISRSSTHYRRRVHASSAAMAVAKEAVAISNRPERPPTYIRGSYGYTG